MRLVRPALALALAGVAAAGSFAFAAEAPKTTATSKTLFLAQEGCGTTAEAGRLEDKAQDDSGDGCGVIGGLPLAEVEAQDEEDFGPLGDDFTTTTKFVPVKVDGAKPITGQLAVTSWPGGFTGLPIGGVGTVTYDVHLAGVALDGKALDFGSVKASGPAAPGQDEVDVPFSLTVPATAAGVKVKAFTLTVFQHGQQVGMTAQHLKGASYLVIPTKAK